MGAITTEAVILHRPSLLCPVSIVHFYRCCGLRRCIACGCQAKRNNKFFCWGCLRAASLQND